MPHARVRPRLGEGRHAHRARPADAAEVVAHEVDDHHVLRPVLLRRGQLRAPVRRARALDRLAAHRAPRAGEEQLRREARHRPPGPGDERGAIRRERGRGGREQVERVALRAAPRAAGRGWPGRGRRPRSAPGTPRRPRRGRAREGIQRQSRVANGSAARRRREPRGELGAPAGEHGLALRRHERLEPPPAGGVQAQHVVVERERAVGQRHGARRRRVAGLDAVARLEAQEAEPAAAHGARDGGPVELRHVVEQREQVVARSGHADRLGAEQRAAAGPRRRSARTGGRRRAGAAPRAPG